jgi:hypothetical protein
VLVAEKQVLDRLRARAHAIIATHRDAIWWSDYEKTLYARQLVLAWICGKAEDGTLRIEDAQ